MKQLLKKIFTLFLTLFITKSFAQTVVTIGGGASISCPNVPTATWTTPPSGVSFSNWSRGSGVTCVSASDGLSGSGFNTASFNASFTANKFFQFTLTNNSTTTTTVSNFLWLTSVSSGGCNFTLAYQNNGGTLTQFGVTGNHPTNNTFSGSLTINPGTSCVFYLIPFGTNSASRSVRVLNGSTITLTSATPVITTAGTLSALSTTYGTASSSTSFTVSATNLASSISITPPVGFEVSLTNTFASVGTNSTPLTVGSVGNLSTTTIFVRLSSTAAPGTYNSQSITLTASGATTRNVTTLSTGNVVNKKTITVTSASVVTKIYDGNNTATINGTLSGVVGSDAVTFVGTGTFSSVNAGTGISVTSTSTLSGAQSTRYNLTQPTGLSGTISKALLTISGISFPNKIYDGLSTVSVVGTPIYVGLVNGESFAVTGTVTWSFASVNAGSGIAINRTGNYNTPSNNYTVTQPTGFTSTITKAPLTISGISFPNKVYDGTTTITPTGTPVYVGLVNGESFSVSGTPTWTLSSANVGNNITISIVGGYNAPSNNYTVTQPSGFVTNITKASQTITFVGLPYKSTLDVDFSPVASASSGLSLTYTSSNTSVATIVSNKIHIVGIGTTTITASQSGDNNYLPATSVSADLFVDEPISRWSFDSLTISGTGQAPLITKTSADLGQQIENTSVTGFHSSTSTVWSSPVGNGNTKSLSATNWGVNDYFRFTVNTKYVTIIKLTFDQTSSATGPKDFKLQWSIDGTNFTDISTYTVPYNTTNNTVFSWSSGNYNSNSTLSFDLSSITEINDQPNVHFRLVNTTTNALLGGTVAPAGTSRMDNFTMFGNLDIPLPLNIISFSGKTFGSQNRLQWTLSEWGVVIIQKYINGTWVEVGKTDNNFWLDSNPYKGLSYYRIVSNNTISNPIYISNPMGIEPSTLDFKYYDMNGKKVSGTETNKIMIRKSEFNSEKIVIVE